MYTHMFCEVCGQRSSRSDEVYCAKVQRSGRGPSEEDAERCDEEEGAMSHRPIHVADVKLCRVEEQVRTGDDAGTPARSRCHRSCRTRPRPCPDAAGRATERRRNSGEKQMPQILSNSRADAAPRADAAHSRTRALTEATGGADAHVRHVHDAAGRATERCRNTGEK